MNYTTPSGFRDVLSEEARQREAIVADVHASFAQRGFQPLETPTLEVMDVVQAGARSAGAPFKFFDSQGDLLAMRPDVTMQIARMCATRLKNQPGPFRFRYTQRVFRENDAQMQAAAREVTQLGVEIIGEEGPHADAEMLAVFAEALEAGGVTDCRLVVGSVGVFRSLLEASGADDTWKDAVLAAYHDSDFVALDSLVSGILEDSTSNDDQFRKAEAAPKKSDASRADREDDCVQATIDLRYARAIQSLARIRGGKEAIDAARKLVEPLGYAEDLDVFEKTLAVFEGMGLNTPVLIDFSVMSSFDYYTGLVVEAYAPGLGTPLGSGGRYDNMLAVYGRSRPAAGFAFYLESVMAARTIQKERARDLGGSIAADDKPVSQQPLRIAVPKGSLNQETIKALTRAGLDTAGLENPGRQLIIRNPGVEYVIVRPTDAPVFVALGAADCGICGKDSLLEAQADVVELVDLEFGACRFVVAEPRGASDSVDEHYEKLGSIRVATKYPRITQEYYAKAGMQVEIVKLHGNIELAPLTGMAERVVDITATGTTLKENDLVVVDEVLSSTARFFANVSAFRTDNRIVELARAFQADLKG